jgi:mRNA interferase RelE/StbE
MSGKSKVAQKLRNFVYPQLQNHPHFGSNIKKLKDFQPDTWRYRIGSWRFFYEIDEQKQIVFMIAASHRSSAY